MQTSLLNGGSPWFSWHLPLLLGRVGIMNPSCQLRCCHWLPPSFTRGLGVTGQELWISVSVVPWLAVTLTGTGILSGLRFRHLYSTLVAL